MDDQPHQGREDEGTDKVARQASDPQSTLPAPSSVAGASMHVEPAGQGEKAPWEGLYDTFMPLLISMTFNSPLQFWELNYMQQQEKFDAAAEDQEKLNSLAVWFGYEPIVVALHEIKQLITDMDAAILDIGCGNGHVCELLFALGFTNVHGLDYSDSAVRLARRVRRLYREQQRQQQGQSKAEGEEDAEGGVILTDGIEYTVGDALATGLPSASFDVIYDKGTFDSIACVSKKVVKSRPPLNLTADEAEETAEAQEAEAEEEAEEEGKEEEEDDRIQYCREVNRLLKPGGFFFMTSQCHDEDELFHFFTRGPEGQHAGCDFVVVKNLTASFADLRLIIFQKPAVELDQD